MTQVAEDQAAQQHTVTVGFEKALNMMNPNWRLEFTADQVNSFRHFYHQGVQDINLLNQLSYQHGQQNLQAVLNTIVVTGNEDRIAEFQKQAAEAQTQTEEPVEVSKSEAKQAASQKTVKAAGAKPAKKGKR